MAESGYLFTLAVAEGQMGANLDGLTDERRIELGDIQCERFDAGADFHLAQSMLTLDDLPASANDEARWGITLAAAQALCPEHEDRITAGAKGD